MTPSTVLKLASIGFGVLWTLGMIVTSGDYSAPSIIITSIAGVLAGFGWYFVMKWFQGFWLKRSQ